MQSVLAVEGSEGVHQVVPEDPTVESATAMANLDAECVLRLEWTPPTADRLASVYPADDAVLRTRVSDGTWCFRALFGERTVMES